MKYRRKPKALGARPRSRARTPSPAAVKRAGPDAHAQRQHKKKIVTKHKQQPKVLWFAQRKSQRETWAAIAAETYGVVFGDGKYVEELSSNLLGSTSTGSSTSQAPLSLHDRIFNTKQIQISQVSHDVSAEIELSRQGTVFYPHYSPSLADWRRRPSTSTVRASEITFTTSSALATARNLLDLDPTLCVRTTTSLPYSSIGVLSFASPKRPGGAYLHGGDELEDVIARCSSLAMSLSSPTAKPFYLEHRKFLREDGSGLHDHSMLYSPGVVVIRSDDDAPQIRPSSSAESRYITPYNVNVLSVVPVNRAAVLQKHIVEPSEVEFFENGIRSAMLERMGRTLRVFEERGDRVVILGAFGCGSSENKVETVAECWAELFAVGKEPRFAGVFEKVVFAVSGKQHAQFKQAYDARIFDAELNDALN